MINSLFYGRIIIQEVWVSTLNWMPVGYSERSDISSVHFSFSFACLSLFHCRNNVDSERKNMVAQSNYYRKCISHIKNRIIESSDNFTFKIFDSSGLNL